MATQKNAADVASRWQRNLSGSVDKIRQGIQSVTESPTDAAARAKDRYIAGVQNAVANGNYERGLRSVTLQQWQELTLTKGVARIASGATAAQPAVQRFMETWLPAQAELSRKVAQMPKGTVADAQARAAFAIAHNAAMKGKVSGR